MAQLFPPEHGALSSNGATLTTSNSIFSNVSGANPPTWITDAHLGDTLLIRLQPQAAVSNSWVNFTTQPDGFFGILLHVVALPTVPSGGTAGTAWCQFVNWLGGATPTSVGGIRVNDLGDLQLRDGFTNVWNSIAAAGYTVTAGATVLFTIECVPGSATGHRLRIYNEDGTLLADSGGRAATSAAQTDLTRFQITQQPTTTSPSYDLRVGRILSDDTTVAGMVPDEPPATADPIAALTETFEAGANGASITAGNSIFDTLPAAEPGVFTDQFYQGTLAGRFATATATRNHRASYSPARAVTEIGFFLLVKGRPSAAATNSTILATYGTGGTLIASQIQLSTDGSLRLRDNVTVRTVSPILTPENWYRVCWRTQPGGDGTTGGHRLRLWWGANIQGSTPDYDSGYVVSTAQAGLTTADQLVVWRPTEAGVDFLLDYILADGLIQPDMSGAGTGPLTVDAGGNQTDIQPWQIVTLAATAAGSGTPTWEWTQTGGTPVALSGTGATRTFTAPATRNGDTLTFQATGTVGGNSASDTVIVTCLVHNEWMYAADGVTLVPVRVMVRLPNNTWSS